MELVRTETQSKLLADRLEAEIRNRLLGPGQKLLSTRDLSEKFGFDRNVVRAALDILEERHLIVKMPRKGIYVNPELFSLGRPELFIFTFGGMAPSYVEMALNLNGDRTYQKDFNVTLRYASWLELNMQTFECEMLKAKRSDPGMIVLASTYIDAAKIRILQSLDIPFVIIGEQHHSEPGLEFNQIFELFAAKGLEIGKFFAKSQFREMAYITLPETMLEYDAAYRTLIQCHAAAAGKKFTEVPIHFAEGQEVTTEESQLEAVKNLFESGARPDLLHFFDSIDINGLQRVLAQFNLRIPDDVTVLAYNPLALNKVPGIYEIFIDYKQFAVAAFELIRRCAIDRTFIGKQDLTSQINYSIERFHG